jgi:hypothetical protein
MITVNSSANASGESNSFTITYNHIGELFQTMDNMLKI